jgi:hypothetical protein
MEMITRISSPISESWVAWLLLILLTFWVAKGMFISEIIMVCRGFFSRASRTYALGSGMQYATWLYRIGLSALIIHVLLYSKDNIFAIEDYGIILGIISIAYCIQWLLIRLIGTVFISHRLLESAIEQRNLINDAVCGLMPIVLLLSGIEQIKAIVLLVLFLVYLVIIFIKSCQLLYKNISSVLYILLYIISLEFIPLVGTILWIKNII